MNKGDTKGQRKRYKKRHPEKVKAARDRYRKTHPRNIERRPYLRYRGEVCEMCGFRPVHQVQLCVDHKDGNHKNNSRENLQTLCHNCHALKTLMNNDYKKKEIDERNVLPFERMWGIG